MYSNVSKNIQEGIGFKFILVANNFGQSKKINLDLGCTVEMQLSL
jgi:hypothetical protein